MCSVDQRRRLTADTAACCRPWAALAGLDCPKCGDPLCTCTLDSNGDYATSGNSCKCPGSPNAGGTKLPAGASGVKLTLQECVDTEGVSSVASAVASACTLHADGHFTPQTCSAACASMCAACITPVTPPPPPPRLLPLSHTLVLVA